MIKQKEELNVFKSIKERGKLYEILERTVKEKVDYNQTISKNDFKAFLGYFWRIPKEDRGIVLAELVELGFVEEVIKNKEIYYRVLKK